MKTLFRNLVLSGILIGTVGVVVPAQSVPNKQEGQRKERVQAVVADKNEKGNTGSGKSGPNAGPAKGEKR